MHKNTPFLFANQQKSKKKLYPTETALLYIYYTLMVQNYTEIVRSLNLMWYVIVVNTNSSTWNIFFNKIKTFQESHFIRHWYI